MANFEYIRDERFRVGLEADYAELNISLSAGAWKAVHVLAGSIVEAVLIDYLVEAVAKDPTATSLGDPLKMDLANAIAACKDAGVLTEKTASLSAVVRTYRNLIHPGRVIRLGEKVDEQGARIAVALTELVVSEVGEARGDKLGYTADQLATKIETDPDTASLLRKHLLPKLAAPEQEKLLLKVLPERYVAEVEAHGSGAASAKGLAEAYKRTFEVVSDTVKKKAATWFAGIVRDEPASVVHLFQEAFFRPSQLGYYAPSDAGLVIDHIFSRLKSDRSEVLLGVVDGIGPWLSTAQAAAAVDIVANEVVYGMSTSLDVTCRQWLLDLVKELRPSSLIVAKARHGAWTKMFEDRGEHDKASLLANLMTTMPVGGDLDDLPF